jgi:uncharacterized repeat protein (TIGR01451 family)
MNGRRRHARVLLLLSMLVCAPACNTHNPSYFPYLLPFDSVGESHAKPWGPGYFANFDPHAVRLEVRPMKDANGQDITNQARTQHVLIATVYDEKGQPRRDRRVDWMIEGAGHILEVDESGVPFVTGRGRKTSDKTAFSYTNRGENRITRGDNVGPKGKDNDFMVRPGQTWCVLSSAIEGDTHVTVYAPGIADWEKNKVYATIRWVDAVWEFPQPGQKAAGAEHSFVTRLARATTKQPLANYRVRYRIKDGPAAYFLPDRTQEYTAVSNLSGNAEARITLVRLGDQLPPPGVNNVDIEVIRPPDPTAPSGSGVVIARGTTSIEWLAPNVVLGYSGPPTALLNEEVTYTASLQNTGKIASDGITLTAPVPRGMAFVRSVPPRMGEVGGEMLFTLGSLPPGGQVNVQLTFAAKELGQTSSAITMRTGSQSDRKEVITNIADARLDVKVTGPQRAAVGQKVPFTVVVTNIGGGVLNGVKLKAELKGGIVEESSQQTSLNDQSVPATLNPGQSHTSVLNIIPKAKGRAEVRAIGFTGTMSAEDTRVLDVSEPMVTLQVDGPKKKYVGKDATFDIRVSNPSDGVLTNVLVRDQLPPELDFVSASNGQFNGREVVWNLGNLNPGETRNLTLVARCKDKSPQTEQRVVVTSDNAPATSQSWNLEIFGAPGLKLEMADVEDPVPAGGKATYKVTVTNTGTEDARNVRIDGEIVGGLERVLDAIPAGIKVDGNKFSFPSTTLKPNDQAVYLINVQAGNRPMDGVLRIQLNADSLQSPVNEDENTRIVNPQGPVANPPQVNNPAPVPFGAVNNNGLTPPPANVGIPPVPAPPMAPNNP